VLLLIVAAAGAAYCAFRPDPKPLIYAVSVALTIGAALAFLTWRRLMGTWFDPYTLFLTSAFLFCCGQALLEVFGLNGGGILRGEFSPQTTLTALYLVAVALAAFHLGAVSAVTIRRRARCNGRGAGEPRWDGSIRTVGWALVAVSIVPAGMLAMRAVGVVMSGGYGALYVQQAGIGIGAAPGILAAFLVPGAIFVLAGSRGGRMQSRLALSLILFNAGINAFLGARYAAFAPLVAFAWVWHRCVRPIRATFLLGAGVFLLVVAFPLISAIRSEPGKERLSLKAISDTFLSIKNPAVAQISEMGGSLIPVAETFELVPRERGFEYGAGYYYAALTVVPNLLWDVHPSVKHGTPAEWLVWRVQPETAAEGGGLGFSFVAEAFLNLGVWGVCLFPLLIGWGYGRLVAWASWSSNPLPIAMVGSFLSFFLIFPRADSQSVVRPLVWYALLPYLVVVLLHGGARARPAEVPLRAGS
jgi:oligosaccharide repeat unit polymerase